MGLLLFGKGPRTTLPSQAGEHRRSEAENSFRQSRVVSPIMLDHFSNTPVAFRSLLVMAEPLLLQTRIFAPTCVIFSAQGIVCPQTFKVAFGERVVLVQKVLSKPVPQARS